MIERFFGFSRRGYLQMMVNKYGDYKVARGWKNKEGDIIWTRHRSVMECWESEEGLRFLDSVNNRTGLECEVRLDTDPKKGETPEQSLEKFNVICDWLDKSKITDYLGFFSGSRGYHVHLFFPKLISKSKERQDELKKYIIKKFGAELLKVSKNTMLTLEFAENNKTSNLKTVLRGNYNWIEDK